MAVTEDGSVQKADQEEYIGLGRAGQESPGRVSANCVWRWCRRGTKAASGERVRLKHIRVGGKIFTKKSWLEEFWNGLAERDSAHFDAKLNEAAQIPLREPRYAPPSRTRQAKHYPRDSRPHQDQVERELNGEGL